MIKETTYTNNKTNSNSLKKNGVYPLLHQLQLLRPLLQEVEKLLLKRKQNLILNYQNLDLTKLQLLKK